MSVRYRVQRAGAVDLEFDGELIANESTRGDSRGARHVDPSRWTEIRIYRLTNGEGWVTESVGKSSRRGEVDRPRVAVCPTPEEVKRSLKRKPDDKDSYLINAAIDALDEAAERDPRLSTVITEQL
jgi:hypothetical protein